MNDSFYLDVFTNFDGDQKLDLQITKQNLLKNEKEMRC